MYRDANFFAITIGDCRLGGSWWLSAFCHMNSKLLYLHDFSNDETSFVFKPTKLKISRVVCDS